MKKLYLPCLIFLFLCTFSLAGCSSEKDDTITSLQESITQLENSIAKLEGNVTTLEEKIAEDEVNTAVNSDSVSETASSIDGLTTYVERMLDKLAQTIPADSEDAKMEQYFNFKNELKQLSNKIDAYDDNLEIQYKKELLNYTDYKIQERDAKALQDKLDSATDDLKVRFRIEN